MLTHVAGRDNDLGLGHVVILNEDNLQEVTNIFIIVDNRTDVVDEVDDGLSHPISWRCLATKDGHPRRKFLALFRGHCFNCKVSVDNAKYVHLLALILVHTLDLDVKKSRWVDCDACRRLDVSSKPDLVGILNLLPLFLEFLVIGIFLEFTEEREILEEAEATDLTRNQLGESGICLVQPSSWSDPVGDVSELVGAEDPHKVLENRRLDEIRMQFCHSVNLVGTNDGEIGHANHLR